MDRGVLRFVCTSASKGTAKEAVSVAHVLVDHGLEGDAHAGSGHRQVSLLHESDIESMRSKGLELEPGAFGENLVIEGVELASLGIGSRLQIAEVVLEVTQVGKVCHSRCAIYHTTGDCIMPRSGVFARVVEGGTINAGATVKVTETVARDAIQAAVLTVSDSCFAGIAEDTTGPAVSALLADAMKAHLAWTGVEPDEHDRLVARMKNLCGRRLDLVVTAGGTGCAPRDVTPEATKAVIDREAPGLAEAMRAASLRITPHALLQRGVAGIRGSTLIVNLPGSRKAAVENLQVILPALPHAIRLLRGDTAHPDDPRRSPGRAELPLNAGEPG